MAERLDALIVREYSDRDGNKKSQWTKIGAAWPMKSGGWSISLEALPLPTMGERGLECRILLREPSNDRQQSRGTSTSNQSNSSRRELDDEIPF